MDDVAVNWIHLTAKMADHDWHSTNRYEQMPSIPVSILPRINIIIAHYYTPTHFFSGKEYTIIVSVRPSSWSILMQTKTSLSGDNNCHRHCVAQILKGSSRVRDFCIFFFARDKRVLLNFVDSTAMEKNIQLGMPFKAVSSAPSSFHFDRIQSSLPFTTINKITLQISRDYFAWKERWAGGVGILSSFSS